LDFLRKKLYWGGHYRFSPDTKSEVFNPAQVLYFLDDYFLNSRIPTDLIDRNVRIDYHKLRHLIIVDRKGLPPTPRANGSGNLSKLTEIIETGSIQSTIVKGFPLVELTSRENFGSLLFYLGLLTISGTTPSGKAVLTIPNETVKRLYYDYIKETYAEKQVFSLDPDQYSRLMEEMAFAGRWEPSIDYLAGRIEASMGLRDLISGEKAWQAFFNVYLGLSPLYIIHEEKESNQDFVESSCYVIIIA
jgi:hypothetical protein